jgi:hypothetical protein
MVGRHAPEKTPTNLAAGGVPATSCRACRYAHFSVRRAVHRGLMLKNQDGRTVGACGVTRRTRSAARTESPSASPTLSSTLSRGQATAFVFGATAITASPTALPGRSKQARPARFYLNSLATLLVGWMISEFLAKPFRRGIDLVAEARTSILIYANVQARSVDRDRRRRPRFAR